MGCTGGPQRGLMEEGTFEKPEQKRPVKSPLGHRDKHSCHGLDMAAGPRGSTKSGVCGHPLGLRWLCPVRRPGTRLDQETAITVRTAPVGRAHKEARSEGLEGRGPWVPGRRLVDLKEWACSKGGGETEENGGRWHRPEGVARRRRPSCWGASDCECPPVKGKGIPGQGGPAGGWEREGTGCHLGARGAHAQRGQEVRCSARTPPET